MNIKELNKRPEISADNKLSRIYTQFGELLNELEKKELNQSVENFINETIDHLNLSTLNGAQLTKLVKQKQTAILKQVKKEHKIVPKNYYRTGWIPVGMVAIGLPIGLAVNPATGAGFGLSMGIIIGLVIGILLDKKSFNDGRQLNIEIKKL